MTRIIVRNLPDRVTQDKLREIFGEKGTITDMQLKYTKTGKFRKFAFIGYQKQEQADSAIDSLNNTYINMSKIHIEHCRELGDPTKPRSWSKHAPDSSAFRKKKKEEGNDDDENQGKKKKIEDHKKIKDPKLEKLLSEYKDDNLFKEFVATQIPNSEAVLEVAEGANRESDRSEKNEDMEVDSTKLADRSISDLEYLKLKTGTELSSSVKKEEKENTGSKPSKNIKLFTVKVKGLVHKMKKSEIKAFFQLKPFSIRKARGIGDVIFLGFKTEAEMKKALLRNRSFFAGKRIHVREVKNDGDEDKPEGNEKWQTEEKRVKEEETIAESGRIFVRNLPYVVTEDDIRALFEKFGPISDIVFPIDHITRKPKGYSLITFVMPEHAAKAFTELDGTIFQGRMLHLLPGTTNEPKGEGDDEASSNYKKSKLKKDRQNAGVGTNWNTFFVGENALAEAMANTYNTTKETILNDSSANVAVRLALGETQIINDMKTFLEENDVCLDSLTDVAKQPRSKRVILVKNLPFGTSADEMRQKFAEFGELKRVVLPPNGITAIVEFIEPSEARKAFRRVAYSKFKNAPLYLEWAPEKIFNKTETEEPAVETKKESNVQESDSEPKRSKGVSPMPDYIPLESNPVEGCTIFVKGLNFSTDEETVREHFSKCGKVKSVNIIRKKDPKNPGQKLSLGYGFVQFSTKEEADSALKKLQLSKLDGNVVDLKRSNRQTKPEQVVIKNSSSGQGKPNPKILVKNVPFQATQKELYDLFKVFGDIKSVRLPKKMVGTGSHRGFCFIEYNTVHDAKRAFKALCQSTHLYGRRLVLEWASTDDDDVDVIRAKTAERFASGKKSKKKITMDEDGEPE